MYDIQFSKSAAKIMGLISLSDKKLYSRLVSAIEALSTDPFKGKMLKGPLKGDYSLRVGNYRIIYSVYKRQLLVVIIDLGHRREIYN